MPQFDFYSFAPQVFWMLIGFVIIYFFLLKYFLVNLSYYQKINSKLKYFVS